MFQLACDLLSNTSSDFGFNFNNSKQNTDRKYKKKKKIINVYNVHDDKQYLFNYNTYTFNINSVLSSHIINMCCVDGHLL